MPDIDNIIRYADSMAEQLFRVDRKHKALIDELQDFRQDMYVSSDEFLQEKMDDIINKYDKETP